MKTSPSFASIPTLSTPDRKFFAKNAGSIALNCTRLAIDSGFQGKNSAFTLIKSLFMVKKLRKTFKQRRVLSSKLRHNAHFRQVSRFKTGDLLS